MNEPTRYTAYVVPELGNSRVEAQWSRIAEQLPGPRSARRAPPFVFASVLAAAAAVVSWYSFGTRNAESVWEGSVVASDEAPVDVTLAEGTVIELDPRSEVALMHSSAQAVQVSLSDGSARFDVSKKRTRRFSVQMGAVEVLVTGTQFRVARKQLHGGERVGVDVEEGSVEVRRQGAETVTLQAGDHWSAFVTSEGVKQESAPEQATANTDTDEVLPDDTLVERELDDDEAQEDDDAAQGDRARRARRRGKLKAAQSLAAEELFTQANVARRAGRVEEAASLYADLATRHARDRKAALAAFELGRLRMDSLSDVRGAVNALERALKLDARRAFAEDALARLVLAHEALGDRGACVRARERYLSRYPEGVHAQHVSVRCGGP